MRSCRTCGKTFEAVANQQYCHEPCLSPSQVRFERKGGSCRGCGAALEDGRFQYCSDACRPKKPEPAPKPGPCVRICEGCHATWEPKDRKVKTRYCVDCREAKRRSHVYAARQNWRRAIRNRAEGLCEECGATEQQTGAYHHAHHIVPRAEGGQHTLANGKLLCVNCHDQAHGGGALGATLLVAGSNNEALINQIAERVVQLLKKESLV